MPYLIDGHNLIPHVGLRLDAPDDEMALVDLLREFCRLKKKRVDVYFDGAPPGENGSRKFGYVTAHFVRKGRTADEAIYARLRNLGGAARNWTVVSSDREVRRGAKFARAKSVSADEFARELAETRFSAESGGDDGEKTLSEREIDEWLKIFSEKE
jgi:predicted RNA-binding protein with PIN domain